MQEIERYKNSPLVSKLDEGLLNFYIGLISEHRVALSEMFDHDSRASSPEGMKYFPAVYFGQVPSWGIAYSYFRGSDAGYFYESLLEVEDEVLGSKLYSEALRTDDSKEFSLASKKYALSRAHHANTSKVTALARQRQAGLLSNLSDESIVRLIKAIEDGQGLKRVASDSSGRREAEISVLQTVREAD